MKKILFAVLLLAPAWAFAQQPVLTQPTGVTSIDYSGTIAVTSTFQKVFDASTGTRGRLGCSVTNNGAATMFIYLGAIADATTPKSMQLASGATYNCASGGIVVLDQLNITGTSGQAFGAKQQ